MGKMAFEKGPDKVLNDIRKALPFAEISLVEEMFGERPRTVEVLGKRGLSVRRALEC